MFRRFLACALVFSVLSGCASVQPGLSPDADADLKAGYVTGQFSKNMPANFAFLVRSLDDGKEYLIPLGPDTSWPASPNAQSAVIKLPPGSYVAPHWVTYGTGTKDILTRKEIGLFKLASPFEVEAGSVTHLGAYDLSSYGKSAPADFAIKPLPLTQEDVKGEFALAYPKLANLPFNCVLCGAAAPAAPAAKP